MSSCTSSEVNAGWVLTQCGIILTVIGIITTNSVVKIHAQSKSSINTAANFRQILLALAAYDESYFSLPAANTRGLGGEELSSWRYRIMPHIQSWPEEVRVDAAWDSPVNAWAKSMKPFHLYCIPSAQENRELRGRMTNVLTITGPGTAFDGERKTSLKDIDSDTILLVEVRNSGLHWMEPGDLDIDKMRKDINHPSGLGISGSEAKGFHVGFADGNVWLLDFRTPFNELMKFFTVKEAKKFDRDEILGKYRIGGGKVKEANWGKSGVGS